MHASPVAAYRGVRGLLLPLVQAGQAEKRTVTVPASQGFGAGSGMLRPMHGARAGE